MGDFDFLTPDTQLRRKPSAPNQSAAAGGTSSSTAGPSSSSAAAAAGTGNRIRIALPSFKEVQAAQRPSSAPNTFQPGGIRPQQQQQQQQQQPPGVPIAPQTARWQQQQLVQGVQQPQQQQRLSTGPGQPAAAAAAAAAGPPPVSSGPSLGLNISIPRYNQSAAPPGQTVLGAVRAPPTAAQPGLLNNNSNSSSSSSTFQQQQQGSAAASSAIQPSVNAVQVSSRQQGNPVLKHIKAVRWMFADIVPDYLCGANTAVLFLSLRYHLLQPEYVLHRLRAVQRAYRLTVLLLLIDVEEVVKPLQELHKAALGADAVLICAFSNEECARYIETLKAYENRPATSIMEKTDTDYLGRLTSALTSIRGVTRSDAFSLASRFGSLADVMAAGAEDFAAVPGLGPVKAKRLVDVFNQPFKKTLGTVTAAGDAAASQQQQLGPVAGSSQGAGQGVAAAAAADHDIQDDADVVDLIDQDRPDDEQEQDGIQDQDQSTAEVGGQRGADYEGVAQPGAAELQHDAEDDYYLPEDDELLVDEEF